MQLWTPGFTSHPVERGTREGSEFVYKPLLMRRPMFKCRAVKVLPRVVGSVGGRVRVPLPPEWPFYPARWAKKAPYKHFRPDQLGATSLRAYAVIYCCFIMADNVEGNSSSKKKGGKRRRSNSREWTWNPEMVESPVNYLKYYKTLCNLNTFDFDGDKVQLYSVLRKRMAAALDICNLYLISTRRIVIILYSAQHWNQHKDAFAWILYRDPCCWKPDEMYTSQRATAWHFYCYPICRVYPSVNDVQSVIYTFKKRKKTTSVFKQHTTKAINQ